MPRKLTLDEIQKELPPGWEVVSQFETSKLQRTLHFSKYSSALDALMKLATLAETMDHHPKMTLGYNFVHVEIYTHTLQAVSPLDLQFAIAADKIQFKE